MTGSRLLLLMIVTLSPLTVWGQAVRTPYPNPALGNGGRIVPRGRDVNLPSVQSRDFNSDAGIQSQPVAITPANTPAAPVTRPQLHYSSPIWQTSQGGGYFAVMGAISQPGVYAHHQSRIGINELIKRAGGATAESSGGVRIVRQGRGGLQTFLSADSRYELLTGDVIFLESHHRQVSAGLRQFSQPRQTAESGLQGGAKSPAAASKKGPPPQAYLAFVNLAPEPIVVPVPADQATLTSVMAWLRQDLKSPPFVRIIPPSPQLLRTVSQPADEPLLESGTVLIFDPTTVKLDRLPEFPPIKAASDNPVSGSEKPVARQEPAKTENPVTPTPRVISDTPLELPLVDRPAARATRSLPAPKAAPAPPAPPKAGTIPRRGLGQQTTAPTGDPRSATGGPMLLMPPNRGSGNPQVTRPDLKSRPAVQSTELEGNRTEEATAAGYESRPVSWESGSSAQFDNSTDPEFAEQGAGAGVIQAHIEQDLGNREAQIGPALELPRPIPNLLPEPALMETPSKPTEAAPIASSVSSTFSLRIVWFSVIGTLVLLALLWWLSRLDGPRPVLARIKAERNLTEATNSVAFRFRRPVMMTEGQPIRRADSVVPPKVLPQAAATPEAKQTDEPALPPPIRSISQREHALRAHFRQARLERAQRMMPFAPEEVETPPETAQIAAPVNTAAPVAEPHVRVPAPHSINKPIDVLGRALQLKRGNQTTE